MKVRTLDHPKTGALALRLGLERWGALGILEALLGWTRVYAIQGDVGRWSDAEIAQGIGWVTRPPAELIEALVATRWLDADPDGRLVIHDVKEHADNAWRQCLEDAGLTWWDGTPPRRQVRGRPRKKNSSAIQGKLQHNSSEMSPKSHQPEPEPEPEDLNPLPPSGAQPTLELNGGTAPASWPQRFVAMWNATVKQLPQATLTPERARRLETRKRHMPDLDAWRRVIETADRSDFYNGKNQSQWRATIDHFIANDTNAAKVLERGSQKVYKPR